jgi:TatA/E family protein of Tat protein translocase
MFGPLGLPELVFILVLALLIFGPKRLPEIGRTVGKAMGEFRRASSELKRTLNTEIALDEEPAKPWSAAPRPPATDSESTPRIATPATAAGGPALDRIAPGAAPGSEPAAVEAGPAPPVEPAAVAIEPGGATAAEEAAGAAPAAGAEADPGPAAGGEGKP